MSNSPDAVGAQVLGVRRGRRRRRPRRRRSTASRGRPGSAPTASRKAARAARGVAVLGVGRDEALVAPPERPPGPSPRRSRAPAARPRRWISSAIDPPVRATCGTPPAAWASSSRVISSPATAVASVAESGWTSMRGCAGHLFFSSFTRRRGGLGVDVVLVEAAQLLGEQLGQLTALERDRAVGAVRRGERRQLAVGAADPDRTLRRSRATTSVIPGPLELLRSTVMRSRSHSHAASRSALGLIRSAVTQAGCTLSRLLVERGGEQRPPGRDPGPGQVGVARGVRRALLGHRRSSCPGRPRRRR